MVNIGTLTAFALVSLAVPILRKSRPDLERSFRVPFNPCAARSLAALICVYLMLNLSVETWLRFLVWMVLGLRRSTSSTATGTAGSARGEGEPAEDYSVKVAERLRPGGDLVRTGAGRTFRHRSVPSSRVVRHPFVIRPSPGGAHVTEARFVHIVDDVPELDGRADGPVLVTALDGFLDAGNAAGLAVAHLTTTAPAGWSPASRSTSSTTTARAVRR